MTTRSLFAGLLAVGLMAVPDATAVQGAPACATFDMVPGPDATDIDQGMLTAVTTLDGAMGEGSALAVGTLHKTGSPSAIPVVAQLSSDGWDLAQTPDLSHLAFPAFEGVAQAPLGGAWVVGHSLDKPSGLPAPLILRLQRGFWRQMSLSMAGDLKGVALRDVVAVSRNQAWAVGDAAVPGSTAVLPFIARFDGQQWTEVPLAPGPAGRLVAVAHDGAGKAWAVGHQVLPSTALPRIPVAYIAHFDGQAWTDFKHPAARPGTTLLDVAALAADDVWAVGTDGASGLFLHWNGREWSEQPGPAGATPVSIAGVSGKDVWAVGPSEYYHFDGQSWMTVPAPITPGLSQRRAIAVAGPCAVWTVGTLSGIANALPLVERAVGAAVPDVPAPPVGLLATSIVDDKATLEWQHAGGATAFLVERCDGEGFACDTASVSSYVVVAKVAPAGSGGTYTDTGLKPDLYFTYRVRAANGAGESEPSASVTIRTPSAEPPTTEVAIPALPTTSRPVAADTVPIRPAPAPLPADTLPTPGPIVADTVPTPVPVPAADTVPVPVTDAAPAPTRGSSVIGAPVPPADSNSFRCTAATAEISVAPTLRLRSGTTRLEVVFKDALGADASALCLPVKWTVGEGSKVTVQSSRGRFATVSGAPGRYTIRALAPNGVFADAAFTID